MDTVKFYKDINSIWYYNNLVVIPGTIAVRFNDNGSLTFIDVKNEKTLDTASYSTILNESNIPYGDAATFKMACANFFVKAPTYGGRILFPYYVDLDFPIIIRTTGTGIPTLETLRGNITAPQWQVNDFNVCEGQELTHAWKEGSEIFWHIHVLTNGTDTANRYLKFEVEFYHANVNSVLSNINTISKEFTIPANTPDRTMLLLSIGSYTYTGGKISSHIWPRLKRIASTGTAPTANPFCTMLQAHILCDSVGSVTILEK